DGQLWWRLAQARLREQKFDDAIAAYQKALELGAFGNKFAAVCHYDMACAYALKGEKEAAFERLEGALALGFRGLDALRRDKDLESLHSDARWKKLAATEDVTKMSRDEAWRYDLWLLTREAQRIHFAPFARFPKAEQDAYIGTLHERIPKMTDDEIMAAFMLYMAKLGDGHTGIRPNSASSFPSLPIQLFIFSDGIFVTATHPDHKELAGAQVLKLNGKPVREVIDELAPLIPKDNPQAIESGAARYLVLPRLHKALGLGGDGKTSQMELRLATGEVKTVTLEGETVGQPTPDWVLARPKENPPLYLRQREKAYFMEHLPELEAVYVQYNAVRNEAGENTTQFTKRLFEFIESKGVKRLIVDVRWNGGGNSFLNQPLLNGIIGAPKLHEPGNLFVITGRNTFSAAQNFTTDLDRALDPIFVGEPTGSSPNFVGETVRFTLPYSKMEGSISDLYWQRSWPMDHRIWIAPDLPAPPVFELFRQGRDPAMEAIEAYIKSATRA
ncbi:MAG TPA: hypothetical protein VEX38_08820, partial [Fimbriimonadaceae bacterium]|nr:hypothetical protein [Fimbriimonadaceae bacterium]